MSLSIKAEWEALDTGPPEERACFAAIGIFSGNLSLTEADDAFVKRLRSSVHLSAYRLAEWFAWNWWRQRWEPPTHAPDWAMVHRMTTIGGGYVWPKISIISDGELIKLIARPTEPHPAEPLRYIANIIAEFRAAEFEGAVSRFIEQVQGKLRVEGVETTNLDNVWSDVCAERSDSETAKRRQLEALLGFDSDEADASLLERRIIEVAELGENAIREMAATSSGRGKVPTARDLRQIADDFGFDARQADAIQLRSDVQLPPTGEVPAWRRGAVAAQELRAQENLDAKSIPNEQLADMLGVVVSNLNSSSNNFDLSFVIDTSENLGRVVLRPKWAVNRRFDIARLLGDRIAGDGVEPLHPATRTFTYRQRLQRSFAAEFLCPFEAVDDMLEGDYSQEKQEECAEYFQVSSRVVLSHLVNHGLINRDDFERESEIVSAI